MRTSDYVVNTFEGRAVLRVRLSRRLSWQLRLATVLIRLATRLATLGFATEPMLPEECVGDGPCIDCDTSDNPRWFAPSNFWNAVMGPDDRYAIVCPQCFIRRAHEQGFRPTAFEIRPEWPWAEHREHD